MDCVDSGPLSVLGYGDSQVMSQTPNLEDGF